MRFAARLWALLLLAALGTATAQSGFQSQSYPAPGTTMMPADFNGDGATDLLFFGETNAVMLNDGHGGFGAAQTLNISGAHAAAVGDVNGDGRPDIALCVANSSNQFSLAVFENDGGGNFHQSWTTAIASSCTGVAVGDANKDGKADLAVTAFVNSSGLNNNSVTTYPGDGSGQFGVPIVQDNINFDGSLFAGTSAAAGQCNVSDSVGTDFSGDGILDLVVTADCPGGATNAGTLWFVRGDGTGHYTFSEIAEGNLSYDYNLPRLVDANHDGKIDVAIVDYQSGPHGSFVAHAGLLLNQGNGIMKHVQTFEDDAYAGFGGYIYAASGSDFNNDGIADSVVGFTEVSSSSSGATNYVAIFNGQPGGTYQESQRWAVPDRVADVVTADFDKNGSRDIAVVESGSNGTRRLVIYLSDQSSGGSSCTAPSSPGALLCAPQAGHTYSSPVQFTGAGTGASGKVDHLELWIDGTKIGNYPENSMTASVALANGSHTATLVEVDSSYHYVKSNPVTFSVGSGGGTPPCMAPSSPGAKLCSPAQGSSVSSPVLFTGAGTGASGKVDHLELWIDGSKIGNYPGNSMSASVALASGSHAATLVEVDSTYHYLKSNPVTFTVR
jgi:FG-GAP-like repeat